MIYLKQIFNGRAAPAFMAGLVLFFVLMEAEGSKIVYKKPITNKINAIKEKQTKSKTIEDFKPLPSTKLAAVAPFPPTSTTTTAVTIMHEELEFAETTHEVKSEMNTEEKPKVVVDYEQQLEPAAGTSKPIQPVMVTNSSMEFREVVPQNENFEENQLEQEQKNDDRAVVEEPLNFVQDAPVASVEAATSLENPTTTILTSLARTAATTTSTVAPVLTTKIITTTTATKPNNRPVPCTCGVFMTSQIKRTGNPYEPPIGRPVIINELDRTYSCNAVGQKQCQTKCLETIVQHLPNSANILCASLDHDIRKERAYLFIKNCRNQWFNTNLAAGREYCCQNGQPYQCPMV